MFFQNKLLCDGSLTTLATCEVLSVPNYLVGVISATNYMVCVLSASHYLVGVLLAPNYPVGNLSIQIIWSEMFQLQTTLLEFLFSVKLLGWCYFRSQKLGWSSLRLDYFHLSPTIPPGCSCCSNLSESITSSL